MPRTIPCAVVSVLFGVTMAVAQLPPHVMLDRHLLHAERLMAQGDPVRELEEMRKALDLKMDHDLELPEDFDSKYAEVAFSAGSLRVAMDSVNRFLETAVCAGSMAQGTGTIKRVWNYANQPRRNSVFPRAGSGER